MDDLTCPSCGDSRVKLLPKVGDRDDYDCPRCHAFSVSGSDRKAFVEGARGELVKDETGKVCPTRGHGAEPRK